MKRISFVLSILISACSSIAPAPQSSGCAGLLASDCHRSKNRFLAEGIPSERTVQLMVYEPMLIGGKPADPNDWPASVYARAGNSACSATIVGDRVLFIASHCVSNGGTVTFSAHANNYKASCSQHPEYRGNPTADWTLCLVDRPVTGVPFEVMGVDQSLELKQPLLLSGYGCINPGGGGGNDGIFRIGFATINGLPSGKNYDVVTRGGAALCFGDSGGSAYKLMSDGVRLIVGVNSRGDISTTSYLPGVFAKTFVSWARSWAKDSNNVRICGIHSDALGCRMSGRPAVDASFEVTSKAACIKGLVRPDYVERKQEIIDGVQKTLDTF